MKRALVMVVVALAVIGAAWVAPRLLDDPGVVSVGVGPWLIEMPLLVWVVAIVVAWVALSLVVGLIRWPGRVLKKRRQRRSRKQLEQGFLALTEGDWAQAQGLFERSVSTQQSTAGLLGAARAAQGLNDFEKRDEWLAQADGRFGRKHFITQLARARLWLSEGRVDQAIELLESLHLKKTKHLGVLRLLLSAYQDAGQWQALRELTPALQRAGMLDAKKAQSLSQLAATRELSQSMDEQALEKTWKALPRRQRQDKRIVLAYAQRAKALGHHNRADQLLSDLLDQSLDPDTLALCRISNDTQRARRIQDLEKRLAAAPTRPELLETLGLLYLDDRQYDKAQRLLEQAIERNASAEAYTALGRLMDRQGEAKQAAHYYRSALQRQDSQQQYLPLSADEGGQ